MSTNNVTLKDVRIATKVVTYSTINEDTTTVPLLGEKYTITVSSDEATTDLPEGVYTKTGDGIASISALPWDNDSPAMNAAISNISESAANAIKKDSHTATTDVDELSTGFKLQQGDGNGIQLGKNGYINADDAKKTVLGFITGAQTKGYTVVGSTDYVTVLRGDEIQIGSYGSTTTIATSADIATVQSAANDAAGAAQTAQEAAADASNLASTANTNASAAQSTANSAVNTANAAKAAYDKIVDGELQFGNCVFKYEEQKNCLNISFIN